MAHNQPQRNAETTAGHRAALSRHTPGVVMHDTQGHCGFFLAMTVNLPCKLGGGFGRRPFPILGSQPLGSLPPRAAWAGRMRALHGAALRSRFNRKPLHHFACQGADVAESHKRQTFRGGCFDAVNKPREALNAVPENTRFGS